MNVRLLALQGLLQRSKIGHIGATHHGLNERGEQFAEAVWLAVVAQFDPGGCRAYRLEFVGGAHWKGALCCGHDQLLVLKQGGDLIGVGKVPSEEAGLKRGARAESKIIVVQPSNRANILVPRRCIQWVHRVTGHHG